MVPWPQPYRNIVCKYRCKLSGPGPAPQPGGKVLEDLSGTVGSTFTALMIRFCRRGDLAKTVSTRYGFAMPGRHYLELLDLANGQYGYVTAEDAREQGIDPVQLRLMHHRGLLERVAHGVYRFPAVPTTPLDQYMEAVLWTRTEAVLSHETALDLHDLCDINPAQVHLTVPAAYRLRREMPAMYRLHRRDLGDTTRHEAVPIVTVRRAILDGIESGVGGHLIDQAMETARRRGLVARAELDAIMATRHERIGRSSSPETAADIVGGRR
jgi:predicted transcriptional regulator of viral defense system